MFVLQGAEAFLIPYKEVFQFVEDIVNVKINYDYALNSGDFEAVNSLLHLGIAGTGVLASGIASILGAIPSVLLALTNPGLATDIELYEGCDIIAAGLDVHDITFTYWLIQVWKFAGTQVNMVLAGFMFGALELEFNTAGWMMAAGVGITPLIWFTGLSRSIEPLILFAFAEIRDHTGVKLSISKLCQSFRELFGLERTVADEDLHPLTESLATITIILSTLTRRKAT